MELRVARASLPELQERPWSEEVLLPEQPSLARWEQPLLAQPSELLELQELPESELLWRQGDQELQRQELSPLHFVHWLPKLPR